MTTRMLVQRLTVGVLALILAGCTGSMALSPSPSESESTLVTPIEPLFFTLEFTGPFSSSACEEEKGSQEFQASNTPGPILTRDGILFPRARSKPNWMEGYSASPMETDRYTARAWDSSGRELEAGQVLLRVSQWEWRTDYNAVVMNWDSGVVGIPVDSDVERVVVYGCGEELLEWNAGTSVPFIDRVIIEVDEDSVHFSWAASDPDHDELTVVVEVVDAYGMVQLTAVSEGERGVTIEKHRTSGWAPFRVIVRAGDGIHTTEMTSEPFPLIDIQGVWVLKDN